MAKARASAIFLGVLCIGPFSNGMVLLGITPFAQEVVSGLILLAAVLLTQGQRGTRR